MVQQKGEWIWAFLRLGLGWTFLWAFLDKTFGLGFATEAGNAWIAGGSPTYGYLAFATKGPFVEFYKLMATSQFVEWLFMLGILFVGITLILGVFVRFGSIVGAMMYVLFYTSGFIPPEHNPIIDEHVINFIIMIGFIAIVPSTKLGLGKWWQRLSFVKKYPILR